MIPRPFQERNTILDYSLVNMVADIGGFTGLLLGVSLLNINQILQRVYITSTK